MINRIKQHFLIVKFNIENWLQSNKMYLKSPKTYDKNCWTIFLLVHLKYEESGEISSHPCCVHPWSHVWMNTKSVASFNLEQISNVRATFKLKKKNELVDTSLYLYQSWLDISLKIVLIRFGAGIFHSLETMCFSASLKISSISGSFLYCNFRLNGKF